MSIVSALTRNRAFTDPAADDPRLRGRVYAIPYAEVWSAAVGLAESSSGWTVLSTDARAGEIQAEARTRAFSFVDDVWVRLSLDRQGQTRVDVASSSRVGRADFGTNARRIARFLHALDARLAVR